MSFMQSICKWLNLLKFDLDTEVLERNRFDRVLLYINSLMVWEREKHHPM